MDITPRTSVKQIMGQILAVMMLAAISYDTMEPYHPETYFYRLPKMILIKIISFVATDVFEDHDSL
jgi:hypothetical protein